MNLKDYIWIRGFEKYLRRNGQMESWVPEDVEAIFEGIFHPFRDTIKGLDYTYSRTTDHYANGESIVCTADIMRPDGMIVISVRIYEDRVGIKSSQQWAKDVNFISLSDPNSLDKIHGRIYEILEECMAEDYVENMSVWKFILFVLFAFSWLAAYMMLGYAFYSASHEEYPAYILTATIMMVSYPRVRKALFGEFKGGNP
jgi:hypothetical protein